MQIGTDVLNVLSNAVINENALKLTGQLDRKLYMATNKVLEAAGGKWSRKAQAHVFEGDAAGLMDSIILTGTVVNKKQELGYFPTPQPVVARLLELADIKEGTTVLEPSAGRGAIINGIVENGPACNIVAYEIDPSNVAYMRDNSGIPYEGTSVVGVFQADFLNVTPVTVFDRVVMNPPFARQDDIRHVTHAFRFLKPGGKLVSVMSAGVSFRTNKLTEDFRQLVRDNGGEIIALPDNSFVESGTGVSTVIVTMNA